MSVGRLRVRLGLVLALASPAGLSLPAVSASAVGWYLMGPRGNADINILSSKWKSFGAYDSAEACEAMKAATLKVLRERADANPQDGYAQIALGEGLASQCVSTDDPRLKGD
jgi:hypothetical protein